MFRRRPPRRHIRPPQSGMRPDRKPPIELLIHANQLLEAGNYQDAAEKYEMMAKVAESGSRPHTPHFYLKAGQSEASLAGLKHRLTLFAEHGEWLHLDRARRHTVAELNEQCLKDAAQGISAWLDKNLPADHQNIPEKSLAQKTVLPIHCPSCGGAVHPNELDWFDELTAECSYCISQIREKN